MSEKYTEQQWNEEMGLGMYCNQHIGYPGNQNPWGSCNLECPTCHEVGFYAPRREPWPPPTPDKITRKYRACKWCGFWQEAWGSVFDARGGDSYPGAIFSHLKCGVEKFWGTADVVNWCEKCQANLRNEGTLQDDPLFQQTKILMDNMHGNIPRIQVQ